MSDNNASSPRMIKAAAIGLGIIVVGLAIAMTCTIMHGKRQQADLETALWQQQQRLQQQSQQQSQQQAKQHECKLLDVEDRALKAFRLQLLHKPNEMVPIFNPRFNARQIVIELILLQQHLEFPGMLCKECIARKHMLAIEGYALEAIGLVKVEISQDPEIAKLVEDMNEVARMMRDLQKMFIKDPRGSALDIARVVRGLRKELSLKYGILPV